MTDNLDLGIELGPAMKALRTDKQRKFAYAFVLLGLTQMGAAEWAGYADANNHAWEIAANPSMQEAIKELAKNLLATHLPKAVRALTKIMDDEDNEPAVRMKAALAIADRAGLAVETQHHVIVENKAMSEKELKSEFERLADKFNLSPAVRRELLNPPSANNGQVIDAEFVAVDAKNAATVVAPEPEQPKPHIDGRTGLEDVL